MVTNNVTVYQFDWNVSCEASSEQSSDCTHCFIFGMFHVRLHRSHHLPAPTVLLLECFM